MVQVSATDLATSVTDNSEEKEKSAVKKWRHKDEKEKAVEKMQQWEQTSHPHFIFKKKLRMYRVDTMAPVQPHPSFLTQSSVSRCDAITKNELTLRCKSWALVMQPR